MTMCELQACMEISGSGGLGRDQMTLPTRMARSRMNVSKASFKKSICRVCTCSIFVYIHLHLVSQLMAIAQLAIYGAFYATTYCGALGIDLCIGTWAHGTLEYISYQVS